MKPDPTTCLFKLTKEAEDKALDAYWIDDNIKGDGFSRQAKQYRRRIANGETVEVNF